MNLERYNSVSQDSSALRRINTIPRRNNVFIILAVVCFFWLCPNGYPYGPAGHELVGGIADNKLIGTPAEAKVTELLDGLNLVQAATLPDVIKSWDRNSKAKLKQLKGHPKIVKQLREFFKANSEPPAGKEGEPLHHIFHYTDVPVEAQSYAAGTKGRNEYDLVHMITYCINVLSGKEKAANERKITKAVALILLTHYLGDIHQPLHVGAEYFDLSGTPKPVNGDEAADAVPDAGGNSLKFRSDENHGRGKSPKFHAFWDGSAVDAAKDAIADRYFDVASDATDEAIMAKLAAEEPANWQPGPSDKLETLSEKWADEILPIAREAHTRVEFTDLKQGDFHGETVATGNAVAKSNTEQSYEEWAGEITAQQTHKAGWRLAYLLDKLLH